MMHRIQHFARNTSSSSSLACCSASSLARHHRKLQFSRISILQHQPRYNHSSSSHHPTKMRYSSSTSTSTLEHQGMMSSHQHQQQEAQRPTCITFMTDVEGDGAYFDRFIYHSKVLEFRAVKPSFGRYNDDGGCTVENSTSWNLGEWDKDYFPYDKEVIFKAQDVANGSNSMLVYGGDIWDKGGSDLYVLRQLLSLHARYPHRVHFIMGNRDINKMRIIDELGIPSSDIHKQNDLMPQPHDGVYWLGRTCSGLPADSEGNVVPSTSAAERLKWMLQRTMGSVDAFELRRNELKRERIAIMNGTAVVSNPASFDANQAKEDDDNNISVTDDEVAQSYIRSCNPVSGIMGQYLTNAKLMIRLGSVLFLHGAFPFVPPEPSSADGFRFPTPWIRQTISPMNGKSSDSSGIKQIETRCDSLSNWIAVLNEFASSQVKGWKEYHDYLNENASPQIIEPNGTEGGYFNNTKSGKLFGALIQYGMGTLPDRTKTQSCVYNSWMEDGLPREDLFGSSDSLKRMSDFFKREGIQIILTGHQPVGDAPWPIQISTDDEGKRLWILPCDTSFSGDTTWASIEGCDSSESINLGRGSGPNGRGDVAFSEPLLKLCSGSDNSVSLNIHGCLSDGSYYDNCNIFDKNDKHNRQLGQELGKVQSKDNGTGDTKEGKFWVKGIVDGKHLVSSGSGYNVWNSYIKSS